MESRIILSNVRVVTPVKDFCGSVVIEEGIITSIVEKKTYREGEDLHGFWLCPGIIDIHSDHFEREINPRANTGFPLSTAFHHLDLRAASAGITSLFNAISFLESKEYGRSMDQALLISRELDKYMSSQYFLIRHFLHARLDLTDERVLQMIDEIIPLKCLRLAVYNEHTPGTRQFRDTEKYLDYLEGRLGKTREQLKSLIAVCQEKAANAAPIRRLLYEKLKRVPQEKPIMISSHDDTTRDDVEESIRYGASFCEFPTTREAAQYAKKKGLLVVMGAPNFVLGFSHSGNLSCREALEEGLVDILCSDYHFPAMLLSVTMLISNGWPPWQAINLVTLNPARAAGIAEEVGSIEVGKKADIIAFEIKDNQPVVRRIYVGGELRLSVGYGGCDM